VPVLVDAELKVIAGHGRLLACGELGWSKVPTLWLDHLSPPQARTYMIADNRLAEVATWDDRLLAEQLKDLSLLGLDFSIEVTGFEIGEIDLRIGALDDPPAQHDDPADVVLDAPPGPVCQQARRSVAAGPAPGAVRQCARPRGLSGLDGRGTGQNGVHRPLQCADRWPRHGLGAIRHRAFAMAAGEMSRPAFAVFLATSLRHLAVFCAGGALLYICIDWRHLGELLAAAREADARLENLCIWVKDHAGMGSLYCSQHELVFVFRTGRGRHRNNVQLGRFGRNRSNVWHYPGANSFSRRTEEGNLLALHPTVKPMALVADAMLDCTKHGDIVLDGFLGSGTAVIAAERTGRRCYGLDLDPAYVDTAIRRWQAMTGGTARHAASGRSFDDLVCELEADDAARS